MGSCWNQHCTGVTGVHSKTQRILKHDNFLRGKNPEEHTKTIIIKNNR